MLVTFWTEIMTSQLFFKKTLILRRSGVAIFADIIKIVTMFIKTILKDSRKVRRIRNYVSKWNLYLISWYSKICWFLRCNCAKFHHCRIYVTDFREGAFSPPPHPWAAPKKPILKGLKTMTPLQWEHVSGIQCLIQSLHAMSF